MRLTRKLAFLAAALIAPLSGCTCHSTGSTHVGVLTRKVTLGGVLGKTGIDPEIRAPGATYLFPAFITAAIGKGRTTSASRPSTETTSGSTSRWRGRSTRSERRIF